MNRVKVAFPESAKKRAAFGAMSTLFGSVLFLAGRRLLGHLTANKPQDDVTVKMSHKDFQKLTSGN